MKEYQVKIDGFEGPLDLLLHLIKQYEIDIYDVPLTEVIDQYTEYVHTMQFLELNIASEYLVMAATLIEMKSQMLLPKPKLPEDQEEYIEDPKEKLMERLIEYRKYKMVAEQLKDKNEQQSFTRPPTLVEDEQSSVPMKNMDVSLYDMIGALNKMIQRKQWNAPLEARVIRTEIPIEQRMEEIMQLVERSEEPIVFDELFVENTRTHIVITFIAILELLNENKIYCTQEKNFGTLYIDQRRKRRIKM